MVDLDYGPAGVPVRQDLQDSHGKTLAYLAQPGPWWTGAERVAIARESRDASDCPLCRERKQSLSPEHPKGWHARTSELPEIVVELAHRVRSDPQRLGRDWFEHVAAEIGEGAYVEAVGIVTFLAGADFFCRAIGIPPFPLPEPAAGAATGYVPQGLKAGTAWVSMLPPEDASGPEADMYPDVPFVPNIVRALSQVPGHVRTLREESDSHYVDFRDLQNPTVGRDLDRLQIELVAARVSALNECFY